MNIRYTLNLSGLELNMFQEDHLHRKLAVQALIPGLNYFSMKLYASFRDFSDHLDHRLLWLVSDDLDKLLTMDVFQREFPKMFRRNFCRSCLLIKSFEVN